MSQTIFSTINPATTNGTQLATLLTDFKEAMVSGMSGTARPTELDAGGMWIDTNLEGSPDFKWTCKIWTGTVDVTVFTVNLASNTVGFSGADSTFEIAKISADTAGPVLKLLKERIANSGQTLDGDSLGEIHFVGAGSDNSNPIVCKIRSVASDNATATVSGGYLVFETTTDATTSLVEAMRLIDGKLGVGVSAPEAEVHTRGNNGIKAERVSADALAAKMVIKKKRVAALGQVLNADMIGEMHFNSTDDAGAEATVVKMEVSATETHTATTLGAKLLLKVMAVGDSVLTTVASFGDTIEFFADVTAAYLNAATVETLDLKATATELTLQTSSVASAAAIPALNSNNPLVLITGTTNTLLQGVSSAVLSKFMVITNTTTAQTITVKHQDAAAAAADRIVTVDGADLVLKVGGSITLVYDGTASRWKVVSHTAVVSYTGNHEALTLNGTDITNQYKDLANVAITGSVVVHFNGLWYRPTTDYLISYTGGAGGNTRITFQGDLASALASGDVLHVTYQY